MNNAAKQMDASEQGADRRTVEVSLQHLADQIRWMDQKLMMKIENDISDHYHDQMNEINAFRTTWKKVSI
ncbi:MULTISPECIES: hypothetical protein [Virgibacillus]|uniref:Uncharacterized protein n=2 Tax=Virgibacillus TaxID=84406 RepID=A0A024QCA9_9BACI|nr:MULTISPECIES: hypothetical protein [Virgibacillus]EQB36144.1 hypothetical protein M948_13995 [Virgibacillus sp. CM-4]MYL42011.1 hypothetical protein [Virgibacillus massiliensis]GGJ46296.1 hypothetical protein GCM10007111_05370 [Virgibacillus kapii]CDQ39840.1 hypothetical protein BN990_02154 [Virgibacillus massiliensis]